MASPTSELSEFIEKCGIECLNEEGAHPVANIFTHSRDNYLASAEDTDHQLLIRIQFRSPVKLSAIAFHANSEDESAPQTVKVFVGKDNIGFDECGDEEPAQLLQLQPENVNKGEPVQLKFVKFQNVTTLQLFVDENFGAAQTKLHYVQFFGTTAEKMEMKEFKPLKG